MAEGIYLEQLNYLHPKIRPYVKVLLSHEFGFLRDLAVIHSIESGCIVMKNRDVYGDRFQLKICYCRKILNWQVIMNGEDITRAPDFIMEENFLGDVTPETIKTKVPSLVNWCPTNVRCLLNVVLELLQLYKEYQINLLSVNPSLQRYYFEYDTLLSMAEMNKNEIEVCVQNRPLVVLFLIHLNVDFSKLPTALPDSKDLVVLVVEFKDNAKSTVQLMPRIELEDALGEEKNLFLFFIPTSIADVRHREKKLNGKMTSPPNVEEVPDWNLMPSGGRLELPDLLSDMSLIDYVPRVEQLLREKIEEVTKYTYNRKMLYSYLVQFFEPSLINGDNINFKNVSFLLEMDKFYCVLNVNIPLDYPDSRPTLQLLSLIKSSHHRASDLGTFTYNRNMSHEEVARSIFNFVSEKAIDEYRKIITS